MKNYYVTIPITGHVDIVCSYDGDPTDGALESAAIDQWDKMSKRQQHDCITWEFTQVVCKGNVCSAECNEMSWDETDTEPEEAKPPTKAQLWRRVASLAGKLSFFLPSEPLVLEGDSPLDLVRRLVAPEQRFETKRETKLARRLKDALAAWKAAK